MNKAITLLIIGVFSEFCNFLLLSYYILYKCKATNAMKHKPRNHSGPIFVILRCQQIIVGKVFDLWIC